MGQSYVACREYPCFIGLSYLPKLAPSLPSKYPQWKFGAHLREGAAFRQSKHIEPHCQMGGAVSSSARHRPSRRQRESV